MAEMKLKTQRGFKTGTCIDDIDVPAPLRIKRKTGISWLDEALGGEGFTPTTLCMVTGVSGGGKSTLTRMLASSMNALGHLPVYNCGEESLYQVKMACERLKAKGFLVGEEKLMPKLLESMDSLKKTNPKKFPIVIQDSLQAADDGKYADGGTTSNTAVRVCEMMGDWAQANYGLSIFVGQVTKDGRFAGKNAIKHAADVHIHFYYDTNKKSPTVGRLLLEVPKNRWGCSGKTFVMRLANEGLACEGSFEKGQDFMVPKS